MKGKGTLEYALRPYRIESAVLEEKHAAVLGMMEIFLGVTPRHCRYLYIWPPAYDCLSVLVPNLFNVPFCDFGVGPIDGGLRSLVAYVASRSYGCSYCSAHCAGLGTVWRGPNVYLSHTAKAMMPVPDPTVFDAKQLAAIDIGKKLGPIPTTITTEDVRQMAAVYTAKEQESVINAATLMGFLNRFMDTIGMTLELEPLETSVEHLAETGWTPGVSYEPEADAELMEEDRQEARKREEREKAKSCGGLSFLKMLVGAKLEDSANLAGLPTSDKNVEQLCKDLAGFAPYYLCGDRRMKQDNARNAFVWAFTQQLCRGSEEVPTGVKQLMCYICATHADNTILRAHYAFMASRSGVSIAKLKQVAAVDGGGGGGGGGGGDDVAGDEESGVGAKLLAAVDLARAARTTPSTVSPALVRRIMRLYSPPGVIELLATVSLANMYHRWTSVYVPFTYEPGIMEFVQEHGATLSIDAMRPCTEEQGTWDAIASETRG
eukprot:g11604.t1